MNGQRAVCLSLAVGLAVCLPKDLPAQSPVEDVPVLTRAGITLGPIQHWRGWGLRIEVADGRPVYKDTRDNDVLVGDACRHVVSRLTDGVSSLESPEGVLLWSRPYLDPPGLTLEESPSGAATLRGQGGLLWGGRLKPGVMGRRPERLPAPEPDTSVTRADGIRFVVGHGRATVEDDTQHVLWAGARPDPPRLDIRADGHLYRIGPSDVYIQEDRAESLDLILETGTVRMQDGQGRDIATEPVTVSRLKARSLPSVRADEEIGTPEVSLTADGILALTFLGSDGKPVRYERVTRSISRRPGQGGYAESHIEGKEFWDKNGQAVGTTNGSWNSWRPDAPTPAPPEGDRR